MMMHIILLLKSEYAFDPCFVMSLCLEATLKPDVKICIAHQFIRCKYGRRKADAVGQNRVGSAEV